MFDADDDFDMFSREPKVILLDYQCTLCENGNGRHAWFENPQNKNRSFSEWIVQEQMRNWLIPLFENKTVLMITARKTCWEKITLEQIRKCTGWIPDESFFNPDGLQPPEHKERILLENVFPKYGMPADTPYLALESNSMTRRMYRKYDIKAVRIDDPIPRLPFV